MQAKLHFLDHQIVTSCIAIVKVIFLLFIWKEMAWKIPNLENLEFYTCTLQDHNAKFLIMVYRRNSWVFDNLKFQDASKVALFRPPNSYILHCHSKSGLFTIYLKGNDVKNSKFGKSWLLYMYTVGPQCKIFNYGLQEELMGAIDWILVGINETKWTTLYCMRNDVLQNYLVQFLKCLADNFDNLKFQDASKVAIFRPANSYILHCHSKSDLFTIYLKGKGMKNSKFGKSWILYMYTVGPQCKIFNYGLQEELMGAIDWILVGINETKWTTLYCMRYDVLQNYLVHFLKCLADNFDNLKFQDASKVAILRPPNSYILHCHSKSHLFTIYLKGNDMKNSKFGKSWILYMYTVGPQCKIFNYGLQEELMGAKWLHSGRNKWN